MDHRRNAAPPDLQRRRLRDRDRWSRAIPASQCAMAASVGHHRTARGHGRVALIDTGSFGQRDLILERLAANISRPLTSPTCC